MRTIALHNELAEVAGSIHVKSLKIDLYVLSSTVTYMIYTYNAFYNTIQNRPSAAAVNASIEHTSLLHATSNKRPTPASLAIYR